MFPPRSNLSDPLSAFRSDAGDDVAGGGFTFDRPMQDTPLGLGEVPLVFAGAPLGTVGAGLPRRKKDAAPPINPKATWTNEFGRPIPIAQLPNGHPAKVQI